MAVSVTGSVHSERKFDSVHSSVPPHIGLSASRYSTFRKTLVGTTRPYRIGSIESGDNFCSKSRSETLHAIKICMLNGDDFMIMKDLLRVVVDELPIDKHVTPIGGNLIDLYDGKKSKQRRLTKVKRVVDQDRGERIP